MITADRNVPAASAVFIERRSRAFVTLVYHGLPSHPSRAIRDPHGHIVRDARRVASRRVASRRVAALSRAQL